MPDVATRRLAGFRFEATAPPLTDILPRMDIALFIGFASAGPLNRPVAVESGEYFRDVFGADLPLAWDPVRRETRFAHLGPGVRAFFREGGRRCWVVRVAAERGPAQFRLPGLVQWEPTSGGAPPVHGYARSPGSWFDDVAVATALTSQPITALGSPAADFSRLPLRLARRDEVIGGDLLRLSFGDAAGPVWFLVEDVAPRDQDDALGTESGWWAHGRALGPTPVLAGQPVPRVERLTFELHARHGDGDTLRLAGLGFAPKHPRYWNRLPDDATRFGAPDFERALAAARAGEYLTLWRDATEPRRFPIAGDGRAAVFLPVGMSALPDTWERAVVTLESPLVRDGLDVFSAALFLEPDLASVGMNSLLAEVDSRRREPQPPLVRAGTDAAPDRWESTLAAPSEPGKGLRGIYAALELDEATLVAVPDAVHAGWGPRQIEPVPAPAFDPALPHPSWGLKPCDEEVTSPPGAPQPRWDRFLGCGLRVLAVPGLRVSEGAGTGGTFTLEWSSPDNEVTFVVQEAARPDFADAYDHYRGGERSTTCRGRAPGRYYYRVRAESGGETSDWSDGLGVAVATEPAWQLRAEQYFDPQVLLDVHRALLRLCSARGDMLAVLALPEHYREDEALAHIGRLRSRRDRSPRAEAERTLPLGQGELAALSHGAVYHPWLVTRDDASGRLELLPPDAAACGLIARRTVERSAWSAPANQPFHGLVALSPPLAPVRQLELLTAQLNQIQQAPAGFLTLNADTLSEDEDVRPINVRRLLMLLRRVALRQGMDYVFEPNGPALRRVVQRDFETLLGDLFARGAFAGETRSTSYQVLTDDTVNTSEEAERGRFRVDLKVAPARPLSFVTVRLEQWGERGLATEVV